MSTTKNNLIPHQYSPESVIDSGSSVFPHSSLQFTPFNKQLVAHKFHDNQSSDEDTNESQVQMMIGKEVSLKLFQGIKQLQEPQPDRQYHSARYYLGDDQRNDKKQQAIYQQNSVETPFSIKQYKPSQKPFPSMSLSQVKQLVQKAIQCMNSFLHCRIDIQCRHINKLEKKILLLQNKIKQMPIQLQKVENCKKRINFQHNLRYEKQIEELHQKMNSLEREIRHAKQKQERDLKYKMQSLKELNHDHIFDQNRQPRVNHHHHPMSLPDHKHPLLNPDHHLPRPSQQTQEQQRSLLQGIDEELQNSGLRQIHSHQSHTRNTVYPFAPVTFSDKQISHHKSPAQTGIEETIKKRHQSMQAQASPDKEHTTHKKMFLSSSNQQNDQRMMSFGKHDSFVVMEEEDLLEELSNSGQDQEAYKGEIENEEQGDGARNRQQQVRNIQKHKLTNNPQKSLKFESPSSSLPKQPLKLTFHQQQQQSEVEEFPVYDSLSFYSKRLSISKKQIPSLLNDSQLKLKYKLSQEEKYLLSEIKELRKIVQWDGEEIVEEEVTQKQDIRTIGEKERMKASLRKRQVVDRYEMAIKGFENSLKRENRLLHVLKRTQKQLKIIKNSLYQLIPCQYCSFKEYLAQIL